MRSFHFAAEAVAAVAVAAGLGLAGACGKEAAVPEAKPPTPPRSAAPADTAVVPAADASELPPHQAFEDLGAALAAIIPADARVIGFGELHSRVDRAQVRSSLAAFTAALPAIGAKVSDLVVETWIVDPKCGKRAVTTTKKLEAEVKRPEATKSEIALLADAARAANIQPHAMTLTCKDYEALAPAAQGAPDPIAMLTLTTRELSRVARSAITYRAKQRDPRPWIAVYGGALHNDRFPSPGVEEWSYADAIDLASEGRYVEIDLFVPELAEADQASQTQPWFPLVAGARSVLVWQRGERSFVVILPRTRG